MNYSRVQFSIQGPGTVAEYFAGLQGAPAVAPNPTNQGWALTLPATPGAVTNAPISPDTAALLPNVLDGLGLLYDQRGSGHRRGVNGRLDIGAFEAQGPLFFTHVEKAPTGIFLGVQGAINETLYLQWNNTLDPDGWNLFNIGVTDGTGLLQVTNMGVGTLPMRFYRALRP